MLTMIIIIIWCLSLCCAGHIWTYPSGVSHFQDGILAYYCPCKVRWCGCGVVCLCIYLDSLRYEWAHIQYYVQYYEHATVVRNFVVRPFLSFVVSWNAPEYTQAYITAMVGRMFPAVQVRIFRVTCLISVDEPYLPTSVQRRWCCNIIVVQNRIWQWNNGNNVINN